MSGHKKNNNQLTTKTNIEWTYTIYNTINQHLAKFVDSKTELQNETSELVTKIIQFEYNKEE